MLFRRRNKEPQAPGGAVARQAPNQQPPSDTRAHASKNPGGVGAGPTSKQHCSQSETNYTNPNSLLSQKG